MIRPLNSGEEEYLMTENMVHDAFLKAGHKQYVLHESIFPLKKKERKNIGNIHAQRNSRKKHTKC